MLKSLKNCSRIRLASVFIVATAFALIPENASAQGMFGIFSPDENDFFMRIFAEIVGSDVITSVEPSQAANLKGVPGTTAFSELCKLFLQLLMVVSGFMISWTYMTAAVNTGQDGSFLGKNMDSAWIPVRTGASIMIIAPIPAFGGFSLIQAMGVAAVSFGVGVADYGYRNMVGYYVDKYISVAMPQPQNATGLAIKILVSEAQYLHLKKNKIIKGQALYASGMNTIRASSVNAAGRKLHALSARASASTNKSALRSFQETHRKSTYPEEIYIYPNSYEVGGILSLFGKDRFGATGKITCQRNVAVTPPNTNSATITLDGLLAAAKYGVIKDQCRRVRQLITDLNPYAIKIIESKDPLRLLSAADIEGIRAVVAKYSAGAVTSARAILGGSTVTGAALGASQKLKIRNAIVRDMTNGGFVLAGANYWGLASIRTKMRGILTGEGTTVKHSVTTNYSDHDIAGANSVLDNVLAFTSNLDSALTSRLFIGESISGDSIDSESLADRFASPLKYSSSFSQSESGFYMNVFNQVMQTIILGPLVTYIGDGATYSPKSKNGAISVSHYGFMSDIRDTGNLILDLGTVAMIVPTLIKTTEDAAGNVAKTNVMGFNFTGPIVAFFQMATGPGKAMLGMIMKIISFMMILGFTLAFVIPALPFMFFLIAVVAYLIFFAEAFVALPMSAVGLAHPDGQGPLSQMSSKAVMLVLRLMAQPLVMLIAFAFAMAATEAVGAFVLAITMPAMDSAITSGAWGWLGRIVILTAAVIATVFMIWEVVMGFTNQIFKWVGDGANDLGEAKANQAFVGVAGGAKGASTQMASAAAIADDGGVGGGKPNATPTENAQATDAGSNASDNAK